MLVKGMILDVRGNVYGVKESIENIKVKMLDNKVRYKIRWC